MPVYTIKLKSRQEIAAGTMAFCFEKPDGFNYKAGQFASLTLPDIPDADQKVNTRRFSFASAPFEDTLMFATRMRESLFKQELKKMEPGSEAVLNGPYGSCTLDEDSGVPVVFLTGGIGIAPVRSIVVQAKHTGLSRELSLFYANNMPEDSAFLEELADSGKKNPNYTFIGTMARMEDSSRTWHGETGFITKAMLMKYINDLTIPVYYIIGPQAMVNAMIEMLNEAGVSAANIRTEKFTGY